MVVFCKYDKCKYNKEKKCIMFRAIDINELGMCNMINLDEEKCDGE